jgi:hypothetical protein
MLKCLYFRCNIPVFDKLSDINACIKVRDTKDLYVGRQIEYTIRLHVCTLNSINRLEEGRS